MNDFNIVKDSTELRKLIAENPELPIVVMVGEEATSSDYYWTYCSDLRCEVGEVLDYACPWNDTRVYNDRIEFEEDLADYLSREIEDADEMPDAEFDRIVETWKDKYSQHWHKAIIVMADN